MRLPSLTGSGRDMHAREGFDIAVHNQLAYMRVSYLLVQGFKDFFSDCVHVTPSANKESFNA
jgi:hypothetical protein